MTTPLANLQALPKYAIPIESNSWSSQDEAFQDIAEGLRQVIEELSSTIQKPLSSETLAETAIAYGNVPRAVTNAVLALDSIDQEQRYNGLYTLQLMTHPVAQEALVGALNHPNRNVRIQAACLSQHDRRAIPVLVEMLYLRNEVPFFQRNDADRFQKKAIQLRRLAIDALCQMGEPALPALIEALESDDDYIRERAASTLGTLQDKQIVPSLINTLDDTSYEVRVAAINALAILQDKQAIPHLIEAFYGSSSEVHRAAIDALVALQDNQTIALLAEALHESNDQVRLTAIDALVALQDKQAVPPLIEALRDPNETIRIVAIKALAALQDKQAIPALIKARYDEIYEVRQAAFEALENLGEQFDPPDEDIWIPPPLPR
jgi:HEAT repeat protein